MSSLVAIIFKAILALQVLGCLVRGDLEKTEPQSLQPSSRTARSAPDDGEQGEADQWNSYDKRLRDFLGKRRTAYSQGDALRSAELADEGLGDSEETGASSNRNNFRMRKRLRDFVGKRSNQNGIDRLLVHKRLRDFLGKRNNLVPSFGSLPLELLPHFEHFNLGSEDFRAPADSEESQLENSSPEFEKRLRDFIGKRAQPDTFLEDKRLREFVGKRSGNDMFTEKKRIREFIGKRDVKRAREFLGKRNVYPEDEQDETIYLENLWDQPSASDGYRLQKRLRDFLGKRFDDIEASSLELPEIEDDSASEIFETGDDSLQQFPALKRLRDFVGKRENASSLNLR